MSVSTAVILAAGRGSRLQGVWDDAPKGFVEVDGESLIARSLRLLRSRGMREIVLVTGFAAEHYRALASRTPGLTLVHNAAFAETGSMASLALALPHVREDFLLLESDLFYEARALDVLLDAREPNLVLLSGPTGAGDEVLVEAPYGRLARMSKRRDQLSFVTGELVGISRISRRLAEHMLAALEAFERGHGHRRMDYETDALVHVAAQHPVHVCLVPDLLWGEVDDAAHLTRVRERVAPLVRGLDAPPLRTPREVLLNPGPATTRDEVKAALVIPDVCPREADFCALYASVRTRLARIAGDEREISCVPLVGSGTTALEAMLRTFVGPQDLALVLDNGDYGARLATLAQRTQTPHVVHRVAWAAPLELDALEREIMTMPRRPTHLVFVHHETSSGLMNPLDALTALARRHDLLVLVDAMSSFGAEPLTVGPRGVDGLVSSANKCLEGMAGLAFAIATNALFERAERHEPSSLVLDLAAERAHLARTGQSRFTVPPQIVSALARALDLFEREGLTGRKARYSASMQRLREGLVQRGFVPLLDERHQSHVLLTLREPDAPWFDFTALHDAMRAQGFTIYPGKPSGVRTFRLSVLGAIDEHDIARFLACLDAWRARLAQ